MKSGYYWVKWGPQICAAAEPMVVFYNAETGNVWITGSKSPATLNCFEVLFKVERTTSVTIEQTESEVEHIQVTPIGPPVFQRRAEFPVHCVTIEHDGVMTEVTGIVTASRSKGTLKRFGFTTAHGVDGTVTLYRDPSRDQSITKQEETNGQEEASRH